jgi:hypothetical protein
VANFAWHVRGGVLATWSREVTSVTGTRPSPLGVGGASHARFQGLRLGVHEPRAETDKASRRTSSSALLLSSYERVGTSIVALLCIVVTVVATSHGAWIIALNLSFWACILALAFGHAAPSHLRLFVPLVPLFYFTFYFNRDVVEIWDKILNSDTPRYLMEAAALRTQTRHIGFPVITFPYVTVNRLGNSLLQLSNVGREFLYLQVAFAGTVAASLLYSTLLHYEQSGSRWPRIRAALVAYCFALSFAIWSLSSVVDTFMVSTMFLMMFLMKLRHFCPYPVNDLLHDPRVYYSARLANQPGECVLHRCCRAEPHLTNTYAVIGNGSLSMAWCM